jgi:acyl carrier protein
MSESIEATAREVLAAALGRDIAPDERPRRADEPAWDSLKHIEIVFSLEGAFGVRFTPDEMPLLDSLDAIVAMVGERRAP